jgi:hypothetical protein
MAVVLGIAPWPWCFYTGAAVLAVIWVQFYVLQRNRPEDLGLAPIDDPVTAGTPFDAPPVPEPERLSRDAWINLLLVSGFHFFDKFIRYALWSWVPYFLELSYGLGSDRAAAFSTVWGRCSPCCSAARCSRLRSAPPWSGATGTARASDVSPTALTAPAAGARMRRWITCPSRANPGEVVVRLR